MKALPLKPNDGKFRKVLTVITIVDLYKSYANV